jgi:acetolactate synthase-1/2/3 large subunit
LELWHFADLDLAAMAETMGVRGMTVRKPSDFPSALTSAIEANGPTLINVVSDIDALAPPGNANAAHS